MTKEEAIRELGILRCDDCLLTYEVEAIDTAISVLQQLSTQWIPVSERLPEDHKDVLIYLSSDQICIGCYNSHRLPFSNNIIGWGASYPHNWCSNDVIAWMPLLTPPNKSEIKTGVES